MLVYHLEPTEKLIVFIVLILYMGSIRRSVFILKKKKKSQFLYLKIYRFLLEVIGSKI